MELKDILKARREAKKNDMLASTIVDNLKGYVQNAKNKGRNVLKKHKAVEDEITNRAKDE